MQSAKGRSLKALVALSQKSQAEDNPWGTPINYSHLSDAELEQKYNDAIASIPVDLSEYEAMAIPELIQEYTGLLG